MKLAVILMVVALYFAGCSSNDKNIMPEDMPKDFAFSVQFGIGSKNVIDTFNGIVIKDLISAGIAKANTTFTEAEMKSIYEKMKAMNVLGPKDFIDDMSCRKKPFGKDTWNIRINDKEKTIQWSSEYCKLTVDAKQFAELRNFVLDIVKQKDEYKKMPEPEGGYA
jgi:hypothetical protein